MNVRIVGTIGVTAGTIEGTGGMIVGTTGGTGMTAATIATAVVRMMTVVTETEMTAATGTETTAATGIAETIVATTGGTGTTAVMTEETTDAMTVAIATGTASAAATVTVSAGSRHALYYDCGTLISSSRLSCAPPASQRLMILMLVGRSSLSATVRCAESATVLEQTCQLLQLPGISNSSPNPQHDANSSSVPNDVDALGRDQMAITMICPFS